MWGSPVTPIIFVVASFVIFISEFLSEPGGRALGLVLVLAGLPVYYLWGRKGAENAES